MTASPNVTVKSTVPPVVATDPVRAMLATAGATVSIVYISPAVKLPLPVPAPPSAWAWAALVSMSRIVSSSIRLRPSVPSPLTPSTVTV